MWHTQEGDRKLKGKERTLFMRGAIELYSALSEAEGSSWSGGAPSFDNLPIEQRLHVLLSVLEQLLNDEPTSELYAWNEGAILAVFHRIRQNVENEAHSRKTAREVVWRTLVQEAFLERCYLPGEVDWSKGEGPDQPVTSTKLDAWDFKILLLTDEILFDRDCEDDEVLDLPPHVAEAVKAQLTISDDYYTGVAPTFTEAVRTRLRGLLEELRKEASSH